MRPSCDTSSIHLRGKMPTKFRRNKRYPFSNISHRERLRLTPKRYTVAMLEVSHCAYSGGEAAAVWGWPLTSSWCRGQRMSGAIPPLPNMPSWHGVQLKKHRDNSTLTLQFHRISTSHVEVMALLNRLCFYVSSQNERAVFTATNQH